MNIQTILQPVIILSSISAFFGIILAICDKLFADYGQCRIIINDDETKALEIKGGDTLLSALLSNKIFIPAACGGKATCGFCKTQVVSDVGEVLPTEKPWLSKKELKSGIRLACQVKVKQDIRINVSEELLNVQEFSAKVVKIEQMTHDIKRFVFKLENPATISFKAGQYIQFKVPGTEEYRGYSVANMPTGEDTEIELMVRHIPGGLCSTYMHEEMEEGDDIIFTGPYGDFYIREDSERDVICVAGGCGLAPVKSIVTYLFSKNTKRNVWFFFGARRPHDIYCGSLFEDIAKKHPNFKFVVALSNLEADDKWDGETGFVHNVVAKHIAQGVDGEGYFCGPPIMIDSALEVLKQKGIPEERVYFDKF